MERGQRLSNFTQIGFDKKNMLELRPVCEHCSKALPPESTEARICSFECTFCSECVETILMNVCPNCGGGFVERPIRPSEALKRNPAITLQKVKPIDVNAFNVLKDRLQTIPHNER